VIGEPPADLFAPVHPRRVMTGPRRCGTVPGVAEHRRLRLPLFTSLRGYDPGWLRGDVRLQQEYAALVAGEESQLRRRLDQLGVVHEPVRDTESAIAAVFRVLERHRHARRR